MTDSDPRIDDHYSDLVPHWVDIVSGPWRADVLWPALEAMLPALDGKRVLDAGCGAGVYTRRLSDAGADVTAVDANVEMVREARERAPAATVREADLTDGLALLDSGSVDAVLCQHVLSHVEDVRGPFEAFARVLAVDGVLVLSTHNPVHDYLTVREGGYPDTTDAANVDPTLVNAPENPTYTDTERYDIDWGGNVSNRATYYRRSVEGLFGPLCAAGFAVEGVTEPAADDASTSDFPPSSLCIRARR